MKKLIASLYLICMVSCLLGQETYNFSDAGRTIPFSQGDSLPGRCLDGQLFRLKADNVVMICKDNVWSVFQGVQFVSVAPSGACVSSKSPLQLYGNTIYGCVSNVWATVGSSGSGSVTSVDTGCGLTGGPITTTGTITSRAVANAQTGTSYTLLAGDCGKLVSMTNAGAITLTVPSAGGSFPDGWYVDVVNIGSTTVTLSGVTGTLAAAQSGRLVSTGATWRFLKGGGAASTIDGCGTGLTQNGSVCDIQDIVVTTNAKLQLSTAQLCLSTTGIDDYACTLSPAPATLGNGTTESLCVVLIGNASSSGASTLNVNTRGIKSLQTAAGGNPTIVSGKPSTFCYDGVQFVSQGSDSAGSGLSTTGSINLAPTGYPNSGVLNGNPWSTNGASVRVTDYATAGLYGLQFDNSNGGSDPVTYANIALPGDFNSSGALTFVGLVWDPNASNTTLSIKVAVGCANGGDSLAVPTVGAESSVAVANVSNGNFRSFTVPSIAYGSCVKGSLMRINLSLDRTSANTSASIRMGGMQLRYVRE